MQDLTDLADELATMGQRLVAVSTQLRATEPPTTAQTAVTPTAAPDAPKRPAPAPTSPPESPQSWAPPHQWAGQVPVPPQPWAGQPQRVGSPQEWAGSAQPVAGQIPVPPHQWAGQVQWAGQSYQWAGSPQQLAGSTGQWTGQPHPWPGSGLQGAGQPQRWPGALGQAAPTQAGGTGPQSRPKPGLLDQKGGGGRLLAWAGGTVTLLGVVLLMVLAVQRGWLGPLPRVIAGGVLGVVMIGLAVRVHRLDGGRTGALALMATGAAALYLDVIAASVLYDFLPVPIGLVVGLMVAAGGLAFADRWREQPLAIMVVAGAALFAPALTGLATPLLVAFVLVLQIAAAPVQLRRGWSGLAIAGAVPPMAAGLLCAGRAAFDGYTTTIVLAAVAVPVTGATIALLSAALDVRLGGAGTEPGDGAGTEPDTEPGITDGATAGAGGGSESSVERPRLARGVPPVLLAMSPAPALLLATQLSRWPGTALALAVAVVAAGLWLTRAVRADLRAVAGVIAAVAGFEATVLAFEGFSLTIALLAQATVLAVVAWQSARSRPGAGDGTSPAGVGGHAVGVLVAAACFLLVGGLQVLAREVSPEVLVRAGPMLDGGRAGLVVALGVSVLLMAAAAAWTLAVNRIGRLGSDAWPLWLLAIGVVLYGEVGAVLSTALLIRPTDGGFVAGHAAVTVSWTVVALVLLVRGVRSRVLRAIGLGLVAAALVKLVAFDLASLDGIARVVTFLGAGLVLLAAGTLYARLVAALDGEPETTLEAAPDGELEGVPVSEGRTAR